MDAFWNELNQIETKEQKLEKRREEGRKEIVGFKLDDYDDDGIKEIEVLQKKYLKILEKAETEKRIKQAVEDFNEAAAEVKTKAEIAAEKAAAKAAEEEAKAAQSSGPAMAATKANALKYVGSDVSALIAAIGNPISKSYAQSCLGAGQDGVLRYQGFTVYTYKEGGKESIQSVE